MLFFEQLEVGAVVTSPTFTVDRDEMVEFAKRWDQLPIHVDDGAANAAFGSGGITAPGVFVIAIRMRLIHQTPPETFPTLIASLGWDEVRFHAPVRPGDTLYLHVELLTKRESKSKPDRGIATWRVSLIDQDNVVVMSHLDTGLVRRISHVL
jgi:acyl dehydratase